MEHIVSVSGGKDSTATYLRAMERGRPFKAVFADTGNEHEQTYEFVSRLSERTGGPEIIWVKQDFSSDFSRRRAYVAPHREGSFPSSPDGQSFSRPLPAQGQVSFSEGAFLH